MKKNLISIFVILLFSSNLFPMLIKVNPRLAVYKQALIKAVLIDDGILFNELFGRYEKNGYKSAQNILYSVRNESGATLLHLAISNRHQNIFESILKYNIDINGNSELYQAIEKDEKEEIISLLNNDVDPNGLTDKQGFTIFDVACECFEASLANVIVEEHKGQIEAPILFAARYGYINSFNVLLNFNSTNIKARNVDGSSILHLLALSYKNKKALRIISAFEDCLKKGFNINDKDKKGKTPLDYLQNNFHMQGEDSSAFTKLVSFYLTSKGAKSGTELKK